MIQKIKGRGLALQSRWQQLNPYQQIALVIYGLMLLLSSIKFIEREVWGVLGTRLVHFGLYFVLGLLLYKGFKLPLLQRCVLTFAVIAALAAIHECWQILIPHTQAQIDDWIADVAGGIIAIGLFASAQIVRDAYRAYRASED